MKRVIRRLRNLVAGGGTRRRIALALGVMSLVAGAGILTLGVLDLFSGDGSVAPPISGAPVIRNVDTAGSIYDQRHATPTPVPTPAPDATPVPPLGVDQPFTMMIDAIGVNAPVQVFGLDKDGIPQVPTGGKEAGQIVAWYDFSARPGTGSNAVFSGHVTWFGDGVFYKLSSLRGGDTIRLVGQDGTEVVYRVNSMFSVRDDDPDAVKVMWGTPDDVITIITCDGAFTKNEDDHVYGGSYDARLVVRGVLDQVLVAGVPQAAGGG